MRSLPTIYFISIAILMGCYGCMVTSSSETYQTSRSKRMNAEELGKAKFFHGDMGGIYPQTLKTNSFVFKIAVLALTALDSNQTRQSSFTKYGFLFSKQIWNWKDSPMPSEEKPTGLVFGKLSGRHPLKGRYLIETADLGCATCHGGPLHGKDGMPTDQFVLGMPNPSINLQGYANDLFEGYQIIIQWNEKRFVEKLLELYPSIPDDELTGLKIIFKGLKNEVRKIAATRGNVSTYRIGGPGTMNGIGAIKNGLGMLDKSVFHKDAGSLVSIPALADRSFRSSFLVSGNYTPKGNKFFYEISSKDTSDRHDQEMASIISLFTIGTMGYNADMAARSIPDVKDVMRFISKFETPAFPGNVDSVKAELGQRLYEKNCQTCHGKYELKSGRNRMVSFPNRLIPFSVIGTDSIRATAITNKDLIRLESIEIGKYFDGQVTKGYVAPILSGAWATSPYFHNGSIPTLWHLMHPSERPEKFYVGGHQLDYEKMGVKGEMKEGVYSYAKDYKSWAEFEIYDTKKRGSSNAGHAEQFTRLTEHDKDCLIEFIKTL